MNLSKEYIKEVCIKNKAGIIIYIVIIGFLIGYYVLWTKVADIYKEYLFNNENHKLYNIEYSDIRTYGFPFYIKFEINDIKLTNKKLANSLSITSNKIFIETVIFTKSAYLTLSNFDVFLLKNKSTVIINESSKIFVNFKNNELSKINFTIKDAQVFNTIETKDNTIYNIENFKFESNKNNSEFDLNHAISLEIGKFTTKQERDNNLKTEFNIITSFSLLNTKYNGVILSLQANFDNLLLNNITANITTKLTGDIKYNFQTSKFTTDSQIKIGNYDILYSLVNDNKNQINNILIGILNTISKNTKDTKTDRYFSFKQDASTNEKLFINSEPMDETVMKILPLIQKLGELTLSEENAN